MFTGPHGGTAQSDDWSITDDGQLLCSTNGIITALCEGEGGEINTTDVGVECADFVFSDVGDPALGDNVAVGVTNCFNTGNTSIGYTVPQVGVNSFGQVVVNQLVVENVGNMVNGDKIRICVGTNAAGESRVSIIRNGSLIHTTDPIEDITWCFAASASTGCVRAEDKFTVDENGGGGGGNNNGGGDPENDIDCSNSTWENP